MGIEPTERTKMELGQAATENQAAAQIALSKGIDAMKKGTVVEALSYFIQSSNADPQLAEAANRLNVLTVNINSGNIGADVRNDIEWREEWITQLKNCEEYYRNYMTEYLPYYLVYSTKLNHLDEIDYVKKTYPLTLKMGTYPVVTWFSTVNQVVQTIKRGLDATGRATAWGLNLWPSKALTSPSPFESFISAYAVQVEIINSDGTRIAGGPVSLLYGWEVRVDNTNNETKIVNVARPVGGSCNVVFFGVDPYKTTDSLSIRIVTVDGIPAENVPEQKRLNIITENEYVRIPGVVF
jgi:hypothetical protein